MNKTVDKLWDGVYSHPLFNEDIARKIRTEIKVGVSFGSDRFTLTRTLLTRTLEFLDMMKRIED